ncbi:hypothetical protein BYT27DRAFT_7193577, partial [Phlegmacium glaucopus]
MSKLALLMTESKLAQLMVTAVMLPNFLQYSRIIMHILAIDWDSSALKMVWSPFHPLLFPFPWLQSEEYMAKYHTMLSTFLADPLHSKEFYINDGKFATLATAFSKCLFGPSIDQVYSDTAPQSSQESLTSIMFITQEECLACAFSCLPYCLPKASPSKSLAVLLQNNELPSDFQDNLFEGHRATVEAIEAYILRCNVSEVSDNNFIMDQSEEIDDLVVPKDGPKASHSYPIIEVQNSANKQSKTKQESNCSCCHV